MFKREYFSWFIVLMLCFAPVIFWFQAPTFIPRFSDLTTSMANIGQILGLIGSAMFAISLLLSARLHFLDKIFGGLDKVYYCHNQLSQLAFIMLLLHPLFLLPKYSGGTFSGAANFLWIGSYWPKNWGVISLYFLIVLIVLTLFLRPKYNIWKWTHKFMGLAFFLASLHVWLIPSDVARYMPLRVYMLSLAGIGLIAFVYRTLLGWLLIKKYKYKVINVLALNDSIYEINMEPIGGPMYFTPGQFIFIHFLGKNISEESHPFSVTSSPNENKLSIIVKNSGDYTSKISSILPGTIAKIEGPFGAFNFKKAKNKNQIWIAGGIGITPFMSMAKSIKKEDGYNIDLYYCVRNEGDAVYLGLLENISAALSSTFKVFPFYSADGIRIDAEFIQKTSGRLSNNNDIFICATPNAIESLTEQFRAKGISKKLIHSEVFDF